MQNKYFDFSRSPEGECTFRRLDGRPPFGDLVISRGAMNNMTYLDPLQFGHVLTACHNYALEGHCVLPASAAYATTVLADIFTASEVAADHHEQISRAGLSGAKGRWDKLTNADLDPIDPPEIRIPEELVLRPIRSGGVEIPPEEYLKTMAIFMLRGFEPGQYLSFYNHYGYKNWLDESVDTPAARLNRAQRWNQLNGARRFDTDAPAHTLLCELFNALPANKRVYLLSEGVQVTIDNTGHVCLHAPKEINKSIRDLPAAKEALNRYRQAHNLPDGEWGFVAIPFNIRTRRR